jgi:hypothetical protein
MNPPIRSKPTRPPILLILLAAALFLAWTLWNRPPPTPLPHAAYIWQREWTDGVRGAIRRNQPFVAEWAVLVAEVEFRPNTAPQVARIAPDYTSLRESGRPVSLTIRVAPWAGPFDPERPEPEFLAQLARDLLDDARQHDLQPAALQLDFDAATRQLDGYRQWLETLRVAIAPTPLVLTALPTWLDNPAFARLIQAADGYVLQVHSWEAPRAPDQPFTLCDPERAKRAIGKAARFDRPFQVALPTYGYRAWFDAQNRLLGLSAEGPDLTTAGSARVREVRADPAAMAGLVRWLQSDRPGALRGLIWYRLPLPEDRLSWNERTWQTVMRGKTPAAKTELRLEPSTDGLVEVAVRAAGDADSRLDAPVTLQWRQARLLAADGLAGFTVERVAPEAARLQPPPGEPSRLAPGQHLTLGWLRFNRPPEISAHVENPHRLASALLGALTLAAPLSSAIACGPFLPSRILIEKDDAFLELPYSTFAYEAQRVPAPYPPPFRAVPPAMGESDTLGIAQARQTEKIDLDELSKALEATQSDPTRRQKILADYTALRQALTAHAQNMVAWKEQLWSGMTGDKPPPEPALAPALTVPEGLPGEFADYLRGAIAYRQKQTEAARQAWQALLDRPADQRRLRSTWAAYMLGRSQMNENPAEALRWFQQARELAGEGYADSLGLAAASLGWEAQMELQQGRYAAALERFRVQLEAGDPAAPISLLLAARHAVSDTKPDARAECANNPTARRLVTGYLLSASLLKNDPRVTAWLDSLKAADAPAEDADRLAWAAYQAGNFELARAWLARAPAQASVAQWLRAKLLLRDGKVAEALPLIAEVAAHFPREPGFTISRDQVDDSEVFDAKRAHAEIGGLRLARGEYIAALDALLLGVDGESDNHWLDAAYVAEQVLTLAELQDFVNRRWPNAPPPPAEGARSGVDARMRYLLARRLARQGRLDQAASYYPADQREDFRRYADALRRGNNTKTPGPQRAEALWTAAQIARDQGMDLLGAESDPDWAIFGGSFDLGTTTTDRPKEGVNRAAPDELKRAAGNLPTPDRRFHYRYRAADLAWTAAQLMPDQSDQTALVLATAGNWIKSLDPKAADRFYKALVRRCGKTDLGKQASAKRWLPEVKPPAAK